MPPQSGIDRIAQELDAIKGTLHDFVSLIKKKESSSEYGQAEANNGKNDADPEVPNRGQGSDTKPPVDQSGNAKSKNHGGKKWLKQHVVEALGVIVVGIYTAVSACTLGVINDSNKISRDALITVQRAFVIFDQTLHEIPLADEKDRKKVAIWQFRAGLQNAGATPTRKAVHHVNWKPFSIDGLPKEFEFPDIDVPGEGPERSFLLGPKMSVTGAKLEMAPQFPTAVNLNQIRLYFWGWSTYDDIFNAHHVTVFCTELTHVYGGDPGDATKTFGVAWSACERHNCADGECDGEPYNHGQVWHAAKN